MAHQLNSLSTSSAQIRIDITMPKGDSIVEPNFVTIVNPAVDFVGATALMQCRDTNNVLLYSFTPILSVVDDNLKVALNEESVNIRTGTHKYDLQITLDNGEIHTWVCGNLIIIKDISHDNP